VVEPHDALLLRRRSGVVVPLSLAQAPRRAAAHTTPTFRPPSLPGMSVLGQRSQLLRDPDAGEVGTTAANQRVGDAQPPGSSWTGVLFAVLFATRHQLGRMCWRQPLFRLRFNSRFIGEEAEAGRGEQRNRGLAGRVPFSRSAVILTPSCSGLGRSAITPYTGKQPVETWGLALKRSLASAAGKPLLF
jgi:hypothetical protein